LGLARNQGIAPSSGLLVCLFSHGCQETDLTAKTQNGIDNKIAGFGKFLKLRLLSDSHQYRVFYHMLQDGLPDF
jgi:hypothetical protein